VLVLVFASGGSAAVVRGSSATRTPLAREANPVQKENLRSGSNSWSLDETAPPRKIEGFASEVSIVPGGKVHFHVSTAPAARYRIVLYRLGWYRGAGARIFACIPGCHRDRRGKARPHPRPARGSGLARAAWPVTDTFRFPRRAVSGYFLAKLELTSGRAHGKVTYIPLILRASPSRRSKILVQASVNTWQAYNSWGGKSLYDFNSTNHVPANHVSFNRPYKTPSPLQWEIGLLRFLEREGYDVSYTTDVDTARTPGELRRHRLVISSGHDEYWSKGMRDAFEAARTGGTNLAFLGADIADWQIRYEDHRRTIVEYRDATTDPSSDPARKTVRFRDLVPPRHQCELLGIGFDNGLIRDANDPPRSYRVNPAALKDGWFRGTGFTATSTLPDSVGYEWDGIQPSCAVPPPTVLFRYQGSGYDGKPSSAEAVRYVAPSGARVFSSGSLQFVWGLDNYDGHHDVRRDPRLKRFMRNALAGLTLRH
jgi:hypothetical protein